MTKKIGALSFEAQLAEYLKIVVPAGSVQAFAGTTPPTDWLICDGRAVSRTVYADLFAAIGVTHGSGNGSTTFNLPDYRGTFLRGLDVGRGLDAGRTLGSYQADAMQGHRHSPLTGNGITGNQPGNSLGNPNATANYSNTTTGDPVTDGTNGIPRTSSETRPKNVAVNYIIKI